MPLTITSQQYQDFKEFSDNLSTSSVNINTFLVFKKAILLQLSKIENDNPLHDQLEDSTLELLKTLLTHFHIDSFAIEELFDECDEYHHYDLSKLVYSMKFLPDLDKLEELGIIKNDGEHVRFDKKKLFHILRESIDNIQAMEVVSIVEEKPEPSANAAASVLNKTSIIKSKRNQHEKPDVNDLLLSIPALGKELLDYAKQHEISDNELTDIIKLAYSAFFHTQSFATETKFSILPNRSAHQLFCRFVSHRDPKGTINRLQGKLEECGLLSEGSFHATSISRKGKDMHNVFFVWFAQANDKPLQKFADKWQKSFLSVAQWKFMNKRKEPPAATTDVQQLIRRRL
jgi:hypothetical protein